METKDITCRIPLALHQKITEEMRAQGITVGQFIEQIIHEHYEKGELTMAKTRTMAFQISEELFQRIKEYLTRFEQVYGRRLTQKELTIPISAAITRYAGPATGCAENTACPSSSPAGTRAGVTSSIRPRRTALATRQS